MTRSTGYALVLLLTVSAHAAPGRSRAVRHPGPVCSFSLSPSFPAAAVASTGLSRGALNVIASPPTCVSWNAYSLTSWVIVERGGNTVHVDVAPNPTSAPRTATLLVAGIRFEIRQEGAAVVTPPIPGNLLRNASFDTDLSFWGWQDRFPNGPGVASWASADANNSPGSGSIRLRNTKPADSTHTFQQLQCVAVDANAIYQYGGKFFATSSSAGSAVWAIVEYADDDCNVAAVASESQTPRIRTPGTWQSETYTKRMGPTTRSAFVVLGSRATAAGTFEVLMDEVFLRPRD